MLQRIEKRKSWISRTVKNPDQRRLIASEIKELRRTYNHRAGYFQARDLTNLRYNFNFDAEKYIKNYMKENKKGARDPLAILDSGAGLLSLSAQLKKKFGKRIFLTSLTLRGPGIPKKIFAEMEKRKNTAGHFEEAKELKAHKAFPKAAKQVDELRISTLEDLQTTRRYDLILDIHGPLTYPLAGESRILEQYLRLLKPGGKLITNKNPRVWDEFPPESKYTQDTGYGFIRRKIEGTSLFTMTKTLQKK
ncbi:MAG: class I SAM-dependent methyltransferase [archaeon]